MTTLTEGLNRGEYLMSEANGTRSRDAVIVTVAGGVALPSGTVLGKITASGKYIKSLEDQGRAEEAAIYVNRQIIGQLDGQRQSLGLLEGAWKTLKDAASGAWQAMLNVGRPDTVGQQLDKVSRQIASFEENLPGANVDSSRRAAIGTMTWWPRSRTTGKPALNSASSW